MRLTATIELGCAKGDGFGTFRDRPLRAGYAEQPSPTRRHITQCTEGSNHVMVTSNISHTGANPNPNRYTAVKSHWRQKSPDRSMTRTVSSRVRVELPARETWRLRCNFELERRIASLGRRKLTLLDEKFVNTGLQTEEVQRRVRCEILGDLGRGTIFIKAEDLTSNVTSSAFSHLFGEENGAQFFVEFATHKFKASIDGRQWAVPIDDNSCFLCTCIELSIGGVPGLGSIIEMQIERQLRESHAAFPKHAYQYTESTTESAVTRTPEPPQLEIGIEPEVVGRHAALRSLFGRQYRKQRLLKRSTSPPGNTVLLRVNPHLVRALLVCGCGKVVEEDEIVE
jgi:hypothetical protein